MDKDKNKYRGEMLSRANLIGEETLTREGEGEMLYYDGS